MSSRLKSIFKRQSSQPNRSTENSKIQLKEISHEMKDLQKISFFNGDIIPSEDSTTENNTSAILRKKNGRRRHRTSLGAVEEILQCGICNKRFQVPKMLPCQHTFCLKCLESQISNNEGTETPFRCSTCFLKIQKCIPEELPTNMYIENMLKIIGSNDEKSEKVTPKSLFVSFATEEIKCSKCSAIGTSENRCKHCRQIFCKNCNPEHVKVLKEELDVTADYFENTIKILDSKIDEFRNKIDMLQENIEKEIEGKILELRKEREERFQKASEMFINADNSAEEIKQRIRITQVEVIEQKSGMYDSVTEDQEKVKIYLQLHRKMTDLIEVVSDWKPKLSDAEISISKSKDHRTEMANIKPNHNLQYKNKSFIPKIVFDHKSMQRPSGLAYDNSRDYVYVACPGIKAKVIVLDKKFKLLRRFHHSEMISPQKVAILQETEEIFVTDKWKHCIFVFSRKGEFLRRMCSKGEEEGQLRGPDGISIHPKERLLYIADSGNDRIVILDTDGSYQGSIGATETSGMTVNKGGKAVSISVNHLNQPSDVAVTLSEVVVADTGNHKIKIFNHKGQLLHSVGGSGVMRGFFRTPEVVNIDSRGNIIVGDSGNGRVQIFSRQGEFLTAFGGKGSKAGQFGWISGLVIKPNLEIIVADSKNNTLQIL